MSVVKALVQILGEFFCKERKQTYVIVLSVCIVHSQHSCHWWPPTCCNW